MSNPITFTVSCNFEVEVTMDADKFDEAFMEEFRAGFYPFDSLHDHAEHIAQLYVREMLDDFTEGYGPIDEMGIRASVTGGDHYVIGRKP